MSGIDEAGIGRRALLGGLAATAGLGLASRAAFAFPTQPITFVVPYAPGSTDQFARAFGSEMEKILENTYRNVNIGLINELAILCDRMGINIWEVRDAAKSKPYGFQAFYPGPGLGLALIHI